jgi:hypothetical protein
VISVTLRPLYTPGKDPVHMVQGARWAPGPVWTGAENLAPTGIRSPDRQARSQSLYRLSYPAHQIWHYVVLIKSKTDYYISFYTVSLMQVEITYVYYKISGPFRIH